MAVDSVSGGEWHSESETISQVRHYWKIKGFSSTRKALKSHVFQTCYEKENPAPEEKAKYIKHWNLKLQPVNRDKGYLSMMLYHDGVHPCGEKAIILTASISVGKSCDGCELVERHTITRPINHIDWRTCWMKLKYQSQGASDIEDMLDRELVISCYVQHSRNGQMSPLIEQRYNISNNSLDIDLLQMYKNQVLTDAVLAVEDASFKVHKVVLSAGSPVFQKLFASDFQETTTNIAEITDINKTVCEILILYLYGEKFPEDLEMTVAEQLLYAAEKYLLDNLKLLCEQILVSKVSGNTTAHLLAISGKYNIENLKITCIQCFKEHCKTVIKTEGWDDIRLYYPQMLSDCILALAP